MPTQTSTKRKKFANTPMMKISGVFVVIKLLGVLLGWVLQRLRTHWKSRLRAVPDPTLISETTSTTSHWRAASGFLRGSSAVTGYIYSFTRGRLTAGGRVASRRPGRRLAVALMLALAISASLLAIHPQATNAATSDTVNFQAKLMTNTGAVAADGYYNVEFKLYTASSGGSALWTEDWLNTNTQGVRVVNGYLTVNLGSITAFPSTINWAQNLYVGMTVRGTGPTCSFGSCSPTDSEMTPRLKLTAVPYAFSAGNLSNVSAGGFTTTVTFQGASAQNQVIRIPDDPTNSTDDVCLLSLGNCVGAGGGITGYGLQNYVTKFNNAGATTIGNSSIFDNGTIVGINATSGSGLLTIQGASSTQSSLFVQGTASASVATSVIKQGSSQTGKLVEFQDSAGNVNGSVNATGNILSLGRVAASGTVTQGKIILADGTTDNFGLTLQSGTLTANQTVSIPATTGSSDTVCLLTLGNCVGSGGGITGSGTQNYLTKFNNAGGTTIGNASLYDNGSFVGLGTTTNSGLFSLTGSSTTQNGIFVQAAASATAADIVTKASSSQTGDMFQTQNNSGTVLSGFNSNGNLYYLNSTYKGTLVSGTLTANRTYTLPDESGTVCLQNSSNCGFLTAAAAATGYIQNNPVSQQTSSSINLAAGSGVVAATFQGAASQDILDLKNSSGSVAASIDSTGKLTANGVAAGSGQITGSGGINVSGGATLAGTIALNGATTNTVSSGTSTSGFTQNITNSNSTATASTVNGHSISLTGNTNGTANANTLNGVNFNNVTPITNNTFNGLYFGTGYNSLLNYNGTSVISGTGILQSSALSGTYSNALTLSNTSNVYTGTSATLSGAVQGGTFNNTGSSFAVDSSGRVTAVLSATTGANLVCQNASNVLSTCTNTYAQTNDTTNFIRNQTSQQASSNFNISGTGIAATALQAPLFQTNDTSAATTNTGALTVRTGNSTTSGNTGTVTIASGNATSGNSGNISIDAGTASGTKGTVSIGTSNASSVTIGRTGINTNIAGTVNLTGSAGLGSNSLNGAGFYKAYTAGTGGVSQYDVVVFANDSSNGRVIDSTTAYDTRVAGVAGSTVSSGSSVSIYTSGTATVNYAGTVPAIGDQLVVSSTSGAVSVDNSATAGILGYATTVGSGGTVGVRIQMTSGQTNPNFAGNVSVGGTFGVTGTTTLTGSLQGSTGSFTSTLQATGAITSGNATTAGSLVIANGNGTSTTLLQSATTAQSFTLPTTGGTLCTTTTCATTATNGYVQLAPASAQTDSTTNSSIFINKTGASGNLIQLQKGGTDQFVVSNGGNVGIGVTTPSAAKLVIQTSSQVGALINQQGSSDILDLNSSGTTKVSFDSNGNQTTSANITVNGAATSLTGASNGTALTVTGAGTTGTAATFNGGNVGIGTTTPGAALDVTGSASKTGTGTLSSSGGTVTGTGTSFTTQLHVGSTITANGQTATVQTITSNTSLTTFVNFSPALSANSFTYFDPAVNVTSVTNQGGLVLQGGSSSTGTYAINVFSGSSNIFRVRNDGLVVSSSNFQSNTGSFLTGTVSTGTSTAVTLQSGSATGTGASGNVNVVSGSASGGNTGNIVIDSGAATGGTAGTVSLGTTNATGISIGRNGVTTAVAGAFTTTGSSAGSGTAAAVNTGAATNVGLTVQAAASQSADLLQLQDNTGSLLQNTDASGNFYTLGNIGNAVGGNGVIGNYLVYSEAFDQTGSWVNTNVTAPTANTTVDPIGTTTAESLATTASGGKVTQTTSLGIGSTYTFSVWLKTASGTQSVDLRVDGSTSGTGTAKTVTATTTWQRFSVTQATTGFTGNVAVNIFPGTASGSGTVKAWGAQLLSGSVPGVYTYTSAAATYAQTYGTATRSLFTSGRNTLAYKFFDGSAPTVAVGDSQYGLGSNGGYLQIYGASSGGFQFKTGTSTIVSTIDGTGNLSTNGTITSGNSTTAGSIIIANGNGTSTTIVGSATTAQTYTLPTAGGTICTTTTCATGTTGSYIQNGTSTQTANFNIQSASASSVGALIQGATSQTADLFQTKDSSGNSLVTIGSAGLLTVNNNNINLVNLGTPTSPTAATGSAGVLTGTYYYRVVFVTAGGSVSGIGNASASVTPSAQQVNLTSIPTSASSLVTARKIYRTVANANAPFYLLTTINDNTTTTYTDNNADGSLGAVYVNGLGTAGGQITFNGSTALAFSSTSTAIGVNALSSGAGISNTAIGINALQGNVSSDNVAVGTNVLRNSINGSGSTVVGSAAFVNATGGGNTGLGYGVGSSVTSATRNVFIGYSAGSQDVTGSNNTYLGYQAGQTATGANNVFLGYQAGQNETGSNKLYIANSNTTTPLIGGDFSASTVTVNGSQTIAGNNAANIGLTVQGAASQSADLLQFQASDGSVLSRIDASGNISTVGYVNSPYGGLGNFQNYLGCSEAFDSSCSSWTTNNVTATGDTTTAPNQTTTADTLADTANGGSVTQSTSQAVGATYTFSIWLKTTSGTQTVGLRVDGNSSGTGSISNVTATTTWQRFMVTQNTTGFGGTVKALIFPGGTAASGTVIAWGAQVAGGSVPGVYATTGTSTVTINSVNAAQGLIGASVYARNSVIIGPTNGNANGSRLYVGNTNAATILGLFKGSSAQTADLFELQDSSSNVNAAFNSTGAQLTLGKASTTSGALVLNNSGSANSVTLQSNAQTNGSYTLSVPNLTANDTICTVATCGTGGLGSYINNQTSQQSSANFNIQGSTGTVSAVVKGESGGTSNIAEFYTSGGNRQVYINSNGTLFANAAVNISTSSANNNSNALAISRTNSSASGTNTQSGSSISLTGTNTSGTNTLNGVNFTGVTAATNNTFTGLNFADTSYNNVLAVNGTQIINGTGILQSAGLSGTYSNALTLNNSGNVFGGTSATLSGAIQGGTVTSTGLTTTAGLTNTGATLLSAKSISDVSAGGNIGTAASTVDVATTFNVNQTTTGQTLLLPAPTVTTAGRIAYVSNVGSASFTIYGITAAPGTTQDFIWNGTAWTVNGSGTTGNYIQNGTTQQTGANFNIFASSGVASKFKGAGDGSDIADFYTNSGSTPTISINSNGQLSTKSQIITGSYAANFSSVSSTITNSNVSTTADSVNAQNIALVGTANSSSCSGTCNNSNGINFQSVTAQTGNTFTGLNFADTSYNNILSVNGTQIINGSGVLQSAGLSGTYSNALTFSNSANSYTGANLNIAATGTSVAGVITGDANNSDILQLNKNGGTGGNGLRVNKNGDIISTHNIQLTGSNTNTSGTVNTTSNYQSSLVGTANSSGGTPNINNGLLLNNVTAQTGNQFNGIYAGTGYDNILNYNGTSIINGTGILQSAGLSGTYSNGLTLSSTSNVYSGTSATLSGAVQGGTFNNTGSTFAVNSSGNVKAVLDATTGTTLVCQNASSNLSACTNTYAQTNDTTNFIRNQTGQQASSNFNISGTGVAATALQAPLFQTADGTGASTAIVFRSGNSTTSGNTGTVTLASGNATSGNSGNISIDVGTASGTKGTISIGTGVATSITIGNSGSTTTVAGNIDQSASSGTLKTGTGAVSLNGDTTVASGKNLNVTSGATTIGGTLATKKGTDYSTTGSQDNINFGTTSLIRLTGASTQTLQGIANGTDGYILTIVNAASQAAIIKNSGSGTGANNIVTGTGGDVSLPAGASLELIYDSGASVWRLTGGVAASGGAGVNTVGSLNGGTANATGATITGTTIFLQSASNNFAGLVDTNAQTFAGLKTFNGGITSANINTTAGINTALGNTTGTFAIQSQGGLNVSTSGDLTGVNSINGDTLTSTALTFSGANPTISASTSNTGLSIQANGTGTLNVGNNGAANTVQIGNTTGAVTQTINIGNNATASSTSNVVIGSTVAGSITLQSAGGVTVNSNISLSTGKTFTANGSAGITFAASSTGNFDQSASSGTFKTGTGAVSLNGDTTVASGKNLTLTSGTVTIGGTTVFNNTGVLQSAALSGTYSNALTLSSTSNVYSGTSATLSGAVQGGTFNNTGSTFAVNSSGNVKAVLDASTGTTLVCQNASSNLSACTNTYAQTNDTTNFIRNQSTSQTGNFNISGTGQAATSLQAPLFQTTDVSAASTASAAVVFRSGNSTTSGNTGTVTLASGNATSGNSGNISIDVGTASGTKGTISIGTGVATSITIGNSGSTTTVAGNIDQSASAGTFKTGTGAVSLNGDTTVALGKNLTVTSGATTIGGTLATKKGSDVSTTGGFSITGGSSSLIRLTGASTQTIQGITNGVDGYRLTIVNAAGQAAVLSNQNGSAGSNDKIYTGTGADVSLPVNASVELIYDAGSNVWRVASGVAASGGAGVNTIGSLLTTPTAANGAIISGTTLTLQSANGSFAGLVDTNAQTFAGLKTFSGGITSASVNTTAGINTALGNTTGTFALQSQGGLNVSTSGDLTGVNSINSGSGNFQVTSAGAVTTASTINGDTLSSTALTFGGANPTIAANTTNTGLSIQSNGTGTLNVGNNGAANTVQIGNTTGAVTQTINIGNNATGSSTSNIVIGSTVAGSTTLQSTGGVTINANVGLSTGKTFTINGSAGITYAGSSTGNFDQSASSGTFKTGTGTVTLNGDTTVTSGRNLTANNINNVAGQTTAIGNSTGSFQLTSTGGLNVTTGGALTGVASINSGSGNFQVTSGGAVTAASTIQGTSVNGTTGINTGAAGGTQRIDANGNLVNIGQITGSFTTATNNASENSFSVTNSNATATATTVNGTTVNLTGTASGTNTINGVNFGNVTTIAGNTFNGLYFGTGYNSLLNYNGSSIINGSGLLTVNGLSGTSGTSLVCQNGTTLSSCTNTYAQTNDTTNFIRNQTGLQSSSNFNISGTGIASTLQIATSGSVDAASAGAINIGLASGGNGTSINLNQNVSVTGTKTLSVGGTSTFTGQITVSGGINVASGQTITYAGSTGAFDQSASSGTFKTGTGAVSLNGDTTVASGKNFTVTSGTTSLTGNLTQQTGTFSLAGNGASTIATNSGTLGVQAAGALSLTTTNIAGGSSAISLQTGNSTSGTAGTITIDNGSSSTGTSQINIGTGNAGAIAIGRANITTTINGNASVASGSQFTNNGSTVLAASTLSDFASSAPIGTAAATVDIYSTFKIPQTTSGKTLTLPTPSTSTAGRLAYVINTGSAAFTMQSVSIQAGKAQTYVFDGTNWTATNIDGAGSGVTFIGGIDSQTKSTDGAVISGNGIYLQSADASFAGLVNTTTQTFAGNKTFNGSITGGAGIAITNGAVSLQGNAASQLTTSSGSLTLDAATALNLGNTNATSVVIGNTANTTSITLNGDTTLGANKSLTYTAGTGNFDQSAASGTFKTGTGNVTLNGNTTISGSKTFGTGTGAVSLNGATTAFSNFTVNNAGSLATRAAADYTTTGSQNDVNLGTASLVRLNGASAQTLTGITGGVDGRILTLVNAGSFPASLTNNDSASTTATDRIITGTGGTIAIPAGGSMQLIYDASAGFWRVEGGVAFGSGSYINNTSTQQTANFNINGTGQAANFDATSGALGIGTSVATQVNIGKSGVLTNIQGTLTSAGLITGSAGLTVTGAAVSLNASSNFATNINTGNSTGAVTIGNTLAGAISIQTASTVGIMDGTTGTAFTVGNTTSNPNIGFVGSGTFGTTSGAVSLNGTTTVATGKNFTVTNGATSLTGSLTQSGGAFSLTGNAASTITTANGTTSGTVTIGTGNASAGTAGTISIDTGTSSTGTGTVNIGTVNAGTVAIGNTTGGTAVNINAGSGGITLGANTSVSGSNTFATGTGAVSLNGSTTLAAGKNLTLNTGAGVITQNYSNTSGSGTIFNTTNSGTSGTNTANGVTINLTGGTTSGTNNTSAINLTSPTVNSGTQNFYGLNFATGFTDLLRYNNTQIISGSGVLQSAGLSGTYSNALTLSSTSNVYSGTSATLSGAVQGGTFNNTGSTFAVNSSGNVKAVLDASTGTTLVCQNASSNLSACTNTYAQTNDTTNFIRNQSTSQTGNFNISGTGQAATSLQAPIFQTADVSVAATNSATVSFRSGNSTTSGNTGNVSLVSGDANSGSAGTITIDNGAYTSGTGTIAIGSANRAHTITIGTGTGTQTVSLGSSNSASTTTIAAGTGGLSIQTQGTGVLGVGANGVTQTIQVGNTTGATSLALQAGSGGINLTGTTTVNSGLIVANTGTLSLQRNTTDITTTGTLTDTTALNTGSLFRFTGATTQTLVSIANPTDGRLVTLVNAGSQQLVLQQDDGSTGTAAYRIITGTGANVGVPVGASVQLTYDSSAQRWRVIGSSASAGGAGVNAIGNIDSQTKSANAAVIAGTTLYLQSADATSGGHVGVVNATTQSFAGDKTFAGQIIGQAGTSVTGGAISLQGNAASQLTTSAGALTLDAATTVNLGNTTATAINIGTTAASTITIGTGTSTINTNGNIVFSATAGATGRTISVAAGANNTDGDSLTIQAAAGTSASGNQAGGDLVLRSGARAGTGQSGRIIIQPGTDDKSAVLFKNSSGSATIFAIDTSNQKVGTVDVNGSSATASLQLQTGNNTLTGNTGSATFQTGDSTGARAGGLTIATGVSGSTATQAGGITIITGAVTAGGGNSGSIGIDTGTAAGGGVSGIIAIAQNNATNVTIGTNAIGHTIGIGTNATGIQNVTIGGLGNNSSTTTLQGGVTGGVTLSAGVSGSNAGTITVGNTTGAATQAINIGTNATASSTTNIAIGNTVAGTTTLQSAGGTTIITTNNPTNVLTVNNNAVTPSNNLIAAQNKGTNKFTVDVNGNVVALGTIKYVDSGVSTTSLVCKDASGMLTACSTTATGAAFVQGGNSFGAQAVLGTSDNNSLAFKTNGGSRAILDVSGNLTFQQASTIATSTGNLTIQANGASVLALDTTGLGTVNIANNNAGTVGVATNDLAHTINVGTGGSTTNQTITVGSTNNGSTVKLQGGASSVSVQNSGVFLGTTAVVTPAASVDVYGGTVTAGTGTLSSSGTTVTGTGTSFTTQLHPGDLLTAAGQYIYVASITSNTSLKTVVAFNPVISGASFTYTQPTIRVNASNAAQSDLVINDASNVPIFSFKHTNAISATFELGNSNNVQGEGGSLVIQGNSQNSNKVNISGIITGGAGLTTTDFLQIAQYQVKVQPTNTGTNLGGIFGLNNLPQIDNSSTNINNVWATYSRIDTTATYTGKITNAYNFYSGDPTLNGTNPIAKYSGIYVDTNDANMGGMNNTTVSAINYGINLNVPTAKCATSCGSGTTTNYGLYIQGGTNATTNYSFANASPVDSYFSGNVSFGKATAPNAAVDIAPSTNSLTSLAVTGTTGTAATATTIAQGGNAGSLAITTTGATSANIFSIAQSTSTFTGTAAQINIGTAGSGAKLLDLQNGGTSKFTVDANGNVTVVNSTTSATTGVAVNSTGASGTQTNGIQVNHNGAGTLTNGIAITNTTGTLNYGISLSGTIGADIYRQSGTLNIQSGADASNSIAFQSSAGANVLSADTSNTNAGLNLISNGSAETGTPPTGYTAIGTGAAVAAGTGTDAASGTQSAKLTTGTSTNGGMKVAFTSAPTASSTQTYLVSLSAKFVSGTAVNIGSGSPNFVIAYSPDNGTTFVNCSNYSQAGTSLTSANWTKINCSFIPGTTTVTTANLYIRQSDTSSRVIDFDNLSVVMQNTTSQNTSVIKIGGTQGQGLTLLQLDTYAGTPFTGSIPSLAGAMYFDTTQGKMQCYDGTIWGACGAAPTSNITLTPEYTGAVLNGTGIGTMTSDFCANDGGTFTVNVSLCASGEARNFYKWTSPQGSAQAYSIYVTYKLPTTFNNFTGTTSLTGQVSNSTNASVTYSVYKSTGSALTQCGTSGTTPIAVTSSAGSWQQGSASGGNDLGSCGFAANNYVIFKINVSSYSNANAYVENLNFNYTNR